MLNYVAFSWYSPPKYTVCLEWWYPAIRLDYTQKSWGLIRWWGWDRGFRCIGEWLLGLGQRNIMAVLPSHLVIFFCWPDIYSWHESLVSIGRKSADDLTVTGVGERPHRLGRRPSWPCTPWGHCNRPIKRRRELVHGTRHARWHTHSWKGLSIEYKNKLLRFPRLWTV